ncbi:hypothetical protein ABZT26_25720 [Streptomyces sp. NPDC005395]|uniref:hypothetical protein n=1 Tax=Streptomyces sp. NPDC005395 TaxID=3157042 RepID=UPI0033A28E80
MTTTRTVPDRTWMDRDNRLAASLDPSYRRPPRPGLWLKRLREQGNDGALNEFDRRRVRQLRLVAYASTLAGADAERDGDLARIRVMVEARGHFVGHFLSDQLGPQEPTRRPGWQEARRLIQQGFADGIACLDRYAISANNDEYELEVRWLAEHAAPLLLDRHEAAT